MRPHPFPVAPAWSSCAREDSGFGASAGLVILILLDRIDDRMASFTEFQHYSPRIFLGQIPKRESQRHTLIYSSRTTRGMFSPNPIATSALQYSSCLTKGRGQRPLLVTSAVPTKASPPSRPISPSQWAASGAKTLLVDGDPRRGALARNALTSTRRLGFLRFQAGGATGGSCAVPASLLESFVLPRGNTLSATERTPPARSRQTPSQGHL